MLAFKGADKLPAFNRRHGLIAFALFLVGLIWFSHDTVSQNMPDIKVPAMLRPSHDDHLNGTLERFWTSKNTYLSDTPYWERPLEVRKIMGLVFYGRRNTVSILDCYLKRNLVKNGGSLDGVIFVTRTTDKDDLDLLKKMLESEDAYETYEVDLKGKDNFSNGFGNSYEGIEDDILYIKIDDDIVFMEDSVIPSLIQTRLAHPEYYTVSANIVNQPLISWLHWNLGAVKPFLPEVTEKGENILKHINRKEIGWKTSTLPSWKGPNNFKTLDWSPAKEGLHRWLPLRRKGSHILDNTPIEKTEYDAFGPGWMKWQIGAQEHYSFLENLEKNELHQYKFAIWDFQYKRMGIQFLALMGRDINIAKPIPGDDENHFSCEMTKKLGRHAVIDGRGVAVHWSFGSQRDGMRWADVLERYRNFAIENICASPMLWEP